MIIDISNSGFKKIFQDEELFLPKRWNGIDFIAELRKLFDLYIDHLKKAPSARKKYGVEIGDIHSVTELLIWTIKDYMDGYPKKAYDTFSQLMDILKRRPFEDAVLNESLQIILYRAVKEKTDTSRTRMFHTPYNMRSKVATCRYSIAGFPCLYLGTSLDLCCTEIRKSPGDSVLASAFKVTDSIILNKKIRVFDLAVKPQDLLGQENETESQSQHISSIPLSNLSNKKRYAYLLWYPVIAACSYIRAFPDAPFAAEYIIPQLFMQWIRKIHPVTNSSKVTGIRYFSCASKTASNMGYNYVFPTSGVEYSSVYRFCKYLITAFSLTEPVFVHDSISRSYCEHYLNKQQFDTIVPLSESIIL